MSSNPEAAQSLSTADKEQLKTYRPSKPIRILTATSLFDGHDASINIIRRLLQSRELSLFI